MVDSLWNAESTVSSDSVGISGEVVLRCCFEIVGSGMPKHSCEVSLTFGGVNQLCCAIFGALFLPR